MISGKQIRAARGLLGWSQQRLADEALVSRSSITRLESEQGEFDQNAGTMELVRRALENAGINFLFDDGSGAEGVRMRKNKGKSSRR